MITKFKSNYTYSGEKNQAVNKAQTTPLIKTKTMNQTQKTFTPYYKPVEVKKQPIKGQFVKKDKNKLRIIPLGGMEEVGRNMTVFEYGDDIIILDMGLQFPEEDMPGIDYIIPNFDYLKGKENKIKAVIFSHGHLDHIGAGPILLEKLNNPTIIGRDLTLALIKHRQEDYKKGSSKKLKTILIKSINDKLTLGNFKISFFQIEHSIMDAVGLIITTPKGTIIHPGDWTLEKNNTGQPLISYEFLAKLPRPTILMLESLGSTDVRPSASSEKMKANISNILSSAKGRVVIGTFASQIERISWILELSEKLGKKVALDGFSMKNNIEIAQHLGYIKPHKNTLIDMAKIADYPDDKVVALVTGAQGEDNAVLLRIIEGRHKQIKLRKNDTIILSSSIIPGNERSIQRLKDNLYRQCDNVIHGSIMDIHVSGHGNKEDIIYMINQIKPDYFIPVYANHYMLKESAKLAKGLGYKDEKVMVADNGQVMEFDSTGGHLTKEKVPSSYVFVDGLGITDSANIVIRDRLMMSEDGMIVIITVIDNKTGKLIGSPDIISRGFVYMKDNRELIQKVRIKIKEIVDKQPIDGINFDDDFVKNKVRSDIGQFLFNQTKRRPMVLPVVIKV
ncbi:ribonuclease J [Candidatus Falkowbacteria bacterium]|nr:ribonuclease J [Candidatus Falkowbacteria bacterium]